MSPEKARTLLQVRPFSMKLTTRENVAGALVRPKPIFICSMSQNFVRKAVFLRSPSLTLTCQYAEFASSLENQIFPAKASRQSSANGSSVKMTDPGLYATPSRCPRSVTLFGGVSQISHVFLGGKKDHKKIFFLKITKKKIS